MVINFFRRSWIFLLPVLLLLVIFRKFFIDGLIPMPADILIGGYYPWLDNKWGFPVSVPVKNSLPADIISIMYPWRVLGMDLLKRGALPLWDETILLGVPLLANFQASLLAPLNVLYFIFSNPVAWGVQVVFQPVLMFAGAYVFLRELGLARESSLFGGMLYAVSGFAMVWLPYNTINYTLAFFPMVLWTVEKIVKNPKLVWGFLLSVFLALQIFSGYPLSVFYTLLFGGVYFFYRLIGLKTLMPRILLAAVGVFLGLTMAGIQLWPGLELSGLSLRNLDNSAVAGNVKYLPVTHLITFFVPDFFGNPGTANYWGIGSYDNFAYFVAAPGLFFFLVSIVTKRSFEKKYLIFSLFALASLIYATDNFVSRALATSFFGLDASVNTRILFVFTLGVSTLAAVGFEYTTSRSLKLWQRLGPFMSYSLMVVGVGLGYLYVRRLGQGLEQLVANNHYLTWLTEVERGEFAKHLANLKIAFRNLAIPSCLILATTISSFFKKKSYLLILVTILTVYSTKSVYDKYTSFIKPELVFPDTPAIEELKRLTQGNRFDMEEAEIFPANSWSVYGVGAAAGQDSLGLLTTARYINLINTQSTKDELLTRYQPIKKHDSPLFDTLNLSHFVALDRDVKESIPSRAGRPFPWIIPEKFKEVANIDTVRIYVNTKNLGPAWFAGEVICEKEWEKVATKLIEKTFDPGRTVFVDCDSAPVPVTSGKVQLINQEPNSLNFRVDAPKENYLVVSHSVFPGWEAYVDGTRAEIKTANVALISILVPPGEHTIRLVYEPRSVKYGALLTLAGLGTWILLFVGRVVVRKQKC